MDLDYSFGEALFGEEGGYLDALIALELDDLAKLFVLDKRAVASELLNPNKSVSTGKNKQRWAPNA